MKRLSVASCITCAVMLLISVSAAGAADESSGPAVVTIEGSAFSPEIVTIKSGAEVIWKNKDSSPHTITADDGSFDSGTINQGGEFRRKFTVPGTVKYSCDIHAYMSGRIEVRP